jgi:hypothetical protein
MSKANFFLVGAAKSGTTSVYDFLNHHSEAFMSPIKEPNFFSTDIHIDKFSEVYRKTTFLDTDKYFSNSNLEPLQLTFVRDRKQYDRLYEKATNEPLIGECSTSYLYSENAAQNIFNYNPAAKIVIVLRNPIQRAYSHYLMALKYGFTDQDFLTAIQQDQAKDDKGWGSSELFIDLGLYTAQIKRYFDLFGEKQVNIMFMEDLQSNPKAFYDSLCEFLKIDKQDPFYKSVKSNSALAPRYPTLNKFLVKFGLKQFVKQISPLILVKLLKGLVFNSEVPKLTTIEKKFILKYYKKEIEKLALLLNRDLKHWLL